MEVKIPNSVNKYLNKLNEPIKSRILQGIGNLRNEPPKGDIKQMSGSQDFRLRIGNYRILFRIRNNAIEISDIDLRGQIYKRR
jgi:mRNA interferase RelE/StbE